MEVYVEVPDASPTPAPFVPAPKTEAPVYSWTLDDDHDDDYLADYTPSPVGDGASDSIAEDDDTTTTTSTVGVLFDDDSVQPEEALPVSGAISSGTVFSGKGLVGVVLVSVMYVTSLFTMTVL